MKLRDEIGWGVATVIFGLVCLAMLVRDRLSYLVTK